MDIVIIESLKKYFEEDSGQVKALDGIDLTVEKGRITAIIGASGMGKTTLFNIIGGLYRPTDGKIIVDGVNLADLTEDQLTVYRRRKVGFIFQDYRLLPELTIGENILLPLWLDDSRPDKEFFKELTSAVGLAHELEKYPAMLSDGGRQCVAIARALITKPSIVLADEPTGNLDAKSARNIAGLLKMTVERFRQTLILITHNLELAQLADCVVRLRDGRVV